MLFLHIFSQVFLVDVTNILLVLAKLNSHTYTCTWTHTRIRVTWLLLVYWSLILSMALVLFSSGITDSLPYLQWVHFQPSQTRVWILWIQWLPFLSKFLLVCQDEHLVYCTSNIPGSHFSLNTSPLAKTCLTSKICSSVRHRSSYVFIIFLFPPTFCLRV